MENVVDLFKSLFVTQWMPGVNGCRVLSPCRSLYATQQHRPLITVNSQFWCFSYLLHKTPHSGMHEKQTSGVWQNNKVAREKKCLELLEPWKISHPNGIFSRDKAERELVVRFLWCSKEGSTLSIHVLLYVPFKYLPHEYC